MDGIQAYAATVAESLAGATWATFQGDKKDFRNGRPVLLNVSGVAIDIRDLAYGEALNASYRGRTVAISYLHDVISDWAVGDS